MGLRVTKQPGLSFSSLARPGIQQAQEEQAVQQGALVSQAVKSGQPISQSQVAQAGVQATQQRGAAVAKETARAGQAALQRQSQANREQQLQKQSQLRTQAMGLREKERELQQNLYTLNNALAQKLFDEQQQFAKDEMGRTVWQTRQLVDWATAKAKSDEDLANFEQNLGFAYKRKMQTLQAAHARITQALEQAFVSAEQDKDQALKARLAQYKKQLEDKMREEQAEAAMWSTILTEAPAIVVGVGAGIATANPAVGMAAYAGTKGVSQVAQGVYQANK